MGASGISLGRVSALCAFAIALLLAACGGEDDGAATPAVALRLERIDAALGLSFPVFLTAPPGDTARLFVVEKGGTIKVVNKATSSLIGTGIFLNIAGLVSTGSEQGLLGLAFDPNYATNRRFYVSYTDTSGNSIIARYLVSSDPNVASSAADSIILTVTQPFANHNGGMIAFGPDGMLYIGFGDGGSAGDPGNRAQNPNELLGKLLRVDVSNATPPLAYSIPSDNPFATAALGKEIWSLGLRNPWRYSFDRQTGDLYIADVGQGNWEEVDVNVSTGPGSAGKETNFGWKVMEGNHCFSPSVGCNVTGLTPPRLEYDHSNGACSITGGYAYRGAVIPALQGTYFYGDFCAGFVRSFRLVNGDATQFFDWTALRPGGNITSFGEDAAGELYIVTSAGGLYRIAPN